jgi:predicted porin
MNKKLVAVAIAGVLAAPLAQAQTANVTLYGRLNVDMEVVNGAILNPNAPQLATCTGANAGTVGYCNTINPNQYRVSSNSSRFGLRGTESLGGGLNAIFQIESSVSPDTSGGTIAGRDTFVGLQGSWGTFRMGRFHGPYDNIHEIWGSNPTLLTGIMATSAIWAQGFAANVQQFDDRIANSVRWDSPVWSGFQLQAQYGNGQGTNAEGTTAAQASNAGVMSIAGYYKNGPLNIGLAWRENLQQRAKGLYDNAYSVAGSWQFTKVKVGMVYERLDYDCSIATATINAQNACNQLTNGVRTNLTRNMFGLGLTIDAGPGQIYADWSWAGDGAGSAPDKARVAGLAHGDGSSANQYEISYTYPLSKRTSVWIGYNKIANDSLAAYNFGVNSYPIAIGGKPQGFGLGGWMNF